MRLMRSVSIVVPFLLLSSCGSPAPADPVKKDNEAPAKHETQSSTPAKEKATAAVPAPAYVSYHERKKTFKTKLRVQGPAPQGFEKETPPKGIREVTYQSDPRVLKAWWFVPEKAKDGKVPAFVFLHGGFAFGGGDFDECKPFKAAGFAVMTPWYRGENGTPGDFELYLGEADDAHAALEWVAKQPEVDAAHIYVFGHSAGGSLASLMSLYAEPAKLTGSAGGLYDQESFLSFGPEIPFDPRSKDECGMRTLKDNLPDMQVPHIAYVGKKDRFALRAAQNAKKVADELKKPLQVVILPGDHFSSFGPALAEFLKVVQEDMKQ